MKIVRVSLALLLVASIAVSQQQADPTGLDPEWKTERQTWTGRLEPSGPQATARLRVVNEFGDIRTRASADSQVDVNAVIQRREDVEEAVELAVVQDDEGVLIEVRFPAAAIEPALLTPGRTPDRRVDLVVFVPPGVELEARTTRGLLEAKGLTGDARLRSERGDVVVTTTGSLDARTDHGSISASFRAREWSIPPRIETVTGDIRVELPRGTNAVGHVATRYEITSDYSIQIERDGLLKTGLVQIGTGGQDLFIESHKGAVKLLEAIE